MNVFTQKQFYRSCQGLNNASLGVAVKNSSWVAPLWERFFQQFVSRGNAFDQDEIFHWIVFSMRPPNYTRTRELRGEPSVDLWHLRRVRVERRLMHRARLGVVKRLNRAPNKHSIVERWALALCARRAWKPRRRATGASCGNRRRIANFLRYILDRNQARKLDRLINHPRCTQLFLASRPHDSQLWTSVAIVLTFSEDKQENKKISATKYFIEYIWATHVNVCALSASACASDPN